MSEWSAMGRRSGHSFRRGGHWGKTSATAVEVNRISRSAPENWFLFLRREPKKTAELSSAARSSGRAARAETPERSRLMRVDPVVLPFDAAWAVHAGDGY